ncbi:hypothetical protein Nm8I071_23010 [Nonomuraea sp. TT08I-71]|nr:hypothetical protein Nm8I071_23010 [Nonomuraea sp. TT08I-71]
MAHREELPAVVIAEHGKVLSDAAGEVQRGLEVVEFACGLWHPAQGFAQRERLHRRQRALDPPAGGGEGGYRAGVVRRFHPVARYVYGRATAGGKRMQALGGAKNHMVEGGCHG